MMHRTPLAPKTLSGDLRLADRVGSVRRTLARLLVFILVFTTLNVAPPFAPKPARAATGSDVSLDFEQADETDFIQENAAKTMFRAGGTAGIGDDAVVGGVTAVSNVISSGGYSTVSDDLVVAATGTITSWRVYSVNTTSLKLKAYRKNGSNNYTLRGNSNLESVTAATVNGPFPASVAVNAGDRVGLYGAYNPYRTTGGLSFFGWNSGDFAGTGSFADSNGAFSHPNVEFTVTSYDTAQAYYITTGDASAVKVRHWSAINGVTITQTTPANTSIKYLVSFDGRATWKYWDGDSWETSSLANLQTDGMSKATLEGLSSADWEEAGAFDPATTETIDFAMDFATTDATAGSSVDQIAFSYETSEDTSLDFDLADEGDFIQEDAANGTDFSASGTAELHLEPGGSQQYALSGGTGGQGGQTTYTAPDGTTAVSSAATYNNANFYYMQYMFDGSGLTGTPSTTQYWLTSSSGNQTLTFTFPEQKDLDYVRVYPYTRADAWSQYSIAVSTDAASWTFIAGSGNASTGVGTTFTHTSQGSAGDNFDYQIDGTYRYVKFTLTQQGLFGVTLNEVQFHEVVDAYTLTGQYVTTSDANQLDVSSWTTLGRVRLDQETPAGGTVKWLVSFDDRASWKYWDGDSWETSTLGNIGTNGNASSTIEALRFDAWHESGGFDPNATTTLDFAFQLKTTDAFATPSVSGIAVEYSTDDIVPPPTNDSTLDNRIVLSRYKAGVAATLEVAYTLQNAKDGTLTITLPAGFTATSAFTAGACAGGGSIDTFGYSASTLTAEKHDCDGIVTLSGATVTNPSTPGLYVISWVNDDPGEGGVAIVDDDQVNVTAQVDSSITFDIDTAATDTESSAPYAVPLGAITPTDTRVSGATDGVNFIWLDLSTNASAGAIVTVRNANGANGLVSASVPTDTIDSSTGAVSDGVENYGICAVAENDAGGNLDDTAPFDGSCAGDTEGNTVGGFDGTAQTIYDTDGAPIASGRAQIAVQASISAVTAAHNDYTDTLTFIATGTY